VVVAALPALMGAKAAGARGKAASQHDPVLLVHGFNGSGSNWTAMVATLQRAGWRADEIDAMSYDSSQSNKQIAHEIATAVAALKARTGATRVDVVSHSMGAISSRWFLERLGGAASVDAWASLAGVNRGTVWAYGCYMLTPCREMVPSSSVIDDLAAHFPPAGATRYATWWSPCDEAVVPQSNAELPGARNTETSCLGHSAVKSDPVVLAQVIAWLGGGRATQQGAT
jgi:triacylglycerol esterase/lipase EstA (alpha/beta hydrolase family)